MPSDTLYQKKEKSTEGKVEKKNLLLAMDCSVKIFSSWLQNNKCELSDIPDNFYKIYKSMEKHIKDTLDCNFSEKNGIDKNKTVTPDYIICLEDGRKLKTLKRHLRAKYNMSVEEYKERWGLPYDYPVVAPNYTKKRSLIAKQIKKNS